MNNFDDAKDRIVQCAEWMHRAVCDVENRYERASTAGANLAAEVYRFLADPEAVGTDALGTAYQHFMRLHAGNFSVSWNESFPSGVTR